MGERRCGGAARISAFVQLAGFAAAGVGCWLKAAGLVSVIFLRYRQLIDKQNILAPLKAGRCLNVNRQITDARDAIMNEMKLITALRGNPNMSWLPYCSCIGKNTEENNA
jgi:hypothetical protein